MPLSAISMWLSGSVIMHFTLYVVVDHIANHNR
jgi:hypothetical protein